MRLARLFQRARHGRDRDAGVPAGATAVDPAPG